MNTTTEIPFTDYPTIWPPTTTVGPSTTQGPPEIRYCNQYISKNKTHFIYAGYEGIPENLLINFCGWIVMESLLKILERTLILESGCSVLTRKMQYKTKLLGYSQYNVWTQLFYGNENEMGRIAGETDSVSSLEFNIHIDKGMFSWIPALFKIKEEHILAKSGRDAVQYLSFQQHLIVYMMIVTVISIVIVLPINFQGTLQGGEKDFGHTTLANLDPKSNLIWLHVTLAFLFLPVGIVFTRRFSKNLEVCERTSSVSRTLMITHVPRRSCHKDTLLRHFQEAYPELDVQDVQFAYSIKSLIRFDKQRDIARNARVYCESYTKETGQRLEMRPYKCGVICGCCDIFGCPKVDAIEFYAEEENRLNNEVENEKIKSLHRPTGVAFITFDTIENAKRVMRDHKNRCRCLGSHPPGSSVYGDLKPQNWVIRVAPQPEDIYWNNLSVTTRHWYVKALLINIVLFLFLFFITTPAVVINSIPFISKMTDELFVMLKSPLLSEFLPTLLLWTCAALMPVIVSYSDQFMSHWTRSAENHSVMRKTFIFLLFMVIILPSLGLTSAKALLDWWAQDALSQNGTDNIRWECVFLPDNGAFFVNYIITSAFIGTTLELIRFPELFMYMVRLGLARSQAETASIRRAILYEFQFGVQYTWMLLAFTMTVFYSVSCPLITPFGTLYMIFKHLVDKYNIYFAYGPSKISKSIHVSAVNFVIVAIVLLQFSLLFLSIVRNGMEKNITIYSIWFMFMTKVLFIALSSAHFFKYMSCSTMGRFGVGRVTITFKPDWVNVPVPYVYVFSGRPTPLHITSSCSFHLVTPPPYSYRRRDSVSLVNIGVIKIGTEVHKSKKKQFDNTFITLRVTTVSAEINAPHGVVNVEEEEEDLVYNRGATPRKSAPTIVTTDAIM
ncbi:unnamed protein product, partial [Meganyctiphanes norvegica]